MLLTKQYLNQTVKTPLEKAKADNAKKQNHATFDVFISYSYHDVEFAYKVVELLEECGYSVYIDYSDPNLNRRNVSKKTAKRLTNVMKKCKGLLFIYSPSSSVSKWCPWEVGLFSGIKNYRCANLPIVDRPNDKFRGQEYLDLYPYIEYEKPENSSKYEFWVCANKNQYATLRDWLNGGKMKMHV